MAILLKWSNQNAPGNTLNVYRKVGTVIAPDDKGPGPIASLDSAAVQYIDNTAEPGITYSYLLEVTASMGSAYSRPTTTENLRRVGPGGVEILVGDSEFGYMGQVPAYQMPDVWAALNFPEGKIAAYTRQLRYYKFVRKGKILFVPSIQMTTQYTGDYDPWLGGIWVANTYGIASGLEWNFDITAAKYNPYRMTKIVEFGNDKFHIRAPRAYPDNWNGVHSQALTQVADTELNQVVQAIYQGCVYGNNVGNVAPITDTLLFGHLICAEGLVQSRETLYKVCTMRTDNFPAFPDWPQGAIVDASFNNGSPDRILYRFRNAGAPTMLPILQLIEE